MLWSAIASGFITALIPIGLAEAAVLAFSAVQPPEFALTLFVAFTLAHVVGKLPWYWLGTVADRAATKSPRAQTYIVKSRTLLAQHPVYSAGVIFSAALASLPPFHLASIAAGIAKVPLWRFLAISIVGRTIRFGIIGALPSLVRALFA